MRKFDTGATRDNDDGKLEPWGFTSALVEKRYSEYMHTHRQQSDGELRPSDNWKNGIPTEAYWHSLSRHLNDLRLIAEGHPERAEESDLETVLCAVKFNVDGLLYEVLKGAKLDARPDQLVYALEQVEEYRSQMYTALSNPTYISPHERDDWSPEYEDRTKEY